MIPVVDLRKHFGLRVTEATNDSRVLVVDIGRDDIGDIVTEVQRISEDSIEPATALVTTEDSYYIEGIAKVEDQLLIPLDLERALDSESIEVAAAVA